MSTITDFCDAQTIAIAKLKEENKELVEALTKIVEKHVYSYLPRKEGVMIKFSFEELEAYRALIKHIKEGG